MHREARRVGSVRILDLAPALAVFRVEEVAQDGEQPCVEVRPALEAMDVGERAQERVLDEVVGAVDLARERDRKGAQARHRREQRIPEFRLWGHFSTASVRFSRRLRSSTNRSGTGCWTSSSYIERRWSPMRSWITRSRPGSPGDSADKDVSGINFAALFPLLLVIMRVPRTVFKAGIPPGVFWHTSALNAEPAFPVPLRGTFFAGPSSVKSGYAQTSKPVSHKGTRMSTAQLVVQHLPYLRRYARALTGSQIAGDAYVAATLETLVNEPETIDQGTNVKVDLFRVFTRIWNSLSVNGKSELIQRDLPAEVRLGQITPLPRQAFLLSCLEGFSEEETAAILSVDVPMVRDLVEEAGRELAADMATDILIIEDEPLIAMDLEALVEGLGHNVSGVARTRTEAVKLAGENRPGLILADIQLADGSSGLDAVNDLLKSFEVPVIFITAYPERFLTGERPEPAFLIAKPFQPANVSAVISQALFFQQSAKRREARATA